MTPEAKHALHGWIKDCALTFGPAAVVDMAISVRAELTLEAERLRLGLDPKTGLKSPVERWNDYLKIPRMP